MSTLIQIFAKAAVPGAVKTRLAKQVGNDAALRIHQCLCQHVVAQARAAGADAVEIWGALDADDPFLRAFGLPVFEQRGRELGTRMDFALRHGLARHKHVVIVGADVFSLSASYLRQAFAALQGSEIVVGPAVDGGYVLIGASRSLPVVFQDVPWGTVDVMGTTMDRLLTNMISFELLPERWDIDTLEDIHRHAPELLKYLQA